MMMMMKKKKKKKKKKMMMMMMHFVYIMYYMNMARLAETYRNEYKILKKEMWLAD